MPLLNYYLCQVDIIVSLKFKIVIFTNEHKKFQGGKLLSEKCKVVTLDGSHAPAVLFCLGAACGAQQEKLN